MAKPQPSASGLPAPSPGPISPREGALRGVLEDFGIILILLVSVLVAFAFPFRPVKFGILGIFSALLLFYSIRRPPMGLALLVFAIPAIDIAPMPFNIRGVNAETFVLLFALIIWIRSRQMHGPDHGGPIVGRFVLAYALLLIVSCFNSWMTWHVSLFDLIASAKNHLVYMIFLPVAFHALRERRDQWLLVGAISLSLVLNAFQGIDHSFMAFVGGSLERHRAMAILAIQPNIFGAALAMYLPFNLLNALKPTGSFFSRFWFAICTGASAFALMLTLSRGGWLGALAGLLVVGLFKGTRFILIGMVLLGAGYQVWVPEAVVARVEATNDVSDEAADDSDAIAEKSAQMRIEQYKSLPAMMAPRPILGWGYKSFPRVFGRYGTLGREKGAHSSYCQLGAEGGVVGLTAMCAVLAAMAWAGWRGGTLLSDPFAKWLAVAISGGAVAMAFCMTNGARFEPQKIWTFIWILLGIVERETWKVRQAQRTATNKIKLSVDPQVRLRPASSPSGSERPDSRPGI